jgi:serine/alanine adding enzyme
MPFRIVPADVLSGQAWLQFVLSSPEGNIFQTPALASVFQGARRSTPFAYAALRDNESEPSALLSGVTVGVLGGPFGRFSSRNVLYGGLLVGGKPGDSDALAPLVETYDGRAKRGVLMSEIRNLHPTERFRKDLEREGYQYRDYLNYLIDLGAGPEALLSGFSSSCRRNIRKAESLGIQVREIEDPAQLAVFYGLIQKTYSRAKVAYADFSLFRRAFDLLRPVRLVAFYLGFLGNVAVAGRVVLLFKDTVYDWYAGSDPTHFKTCANELLVWHAIRSGIQMGFRTYDFGGAGYPDEPYGVRDFKSRFGGSLVQFGRYSKVYSRARFKAAKAGYGIFRRFIG